jgi:hypothetical protein
MRFIHLARLDAPPFYRSADITSAEQTQQRIDIVGATPE